MKTKLPLPLQSKEDKKYPIDYIHGNIDCPNIESRIGKTLSSHAYTFGVDFNVDGFYESDIQWIENNITKNSQNKNRDIFWQFDDYKREKIHRRIIWIMLPRFLKVLLIHPVFHVMSTDF